MACCAERKDFCVGAGTTFSPIIRWGTKVLASVPITGITQTTPAVITAPGHGVPQGWPVAITGVQGMSQINATRYPPISNDYHAATVVSPDTVALNDVSSANFLPYVSGGALVYNTPVSLAGVSAKMTFYSDPAKATTPLLILASGSNITIDVVNCTVIPMLQTAGLLWKTAYYDFDFTDASGVVTRVLEGILNID